MATAPRSANPPRLQQPLQTQTEPQHTRTRAQCGTAVSIAKHQSYHDVGSKLGSWSGSLNYAAPGTTLNTQYETCIHINALTHAHITRTHTLSTGACNRLGNSDYSTVQSCAVQSCSVQFSPAVRDACRRLQQGKCTAHSTGGYKHEYSSQHYMFVKTPLSHGS